MRHISTATNARIRQLSRSCHEEVAVSATLVRQSSCIPQLALQVDASSTVHCSPASCSEGRRRLEPSRSPQLDGVLLMRASPISTWIPTAAVHPVSYHAVCGETRRLLHLARGPPESNGKKDDLRRRSGRKSCWSVYEFLWNETSCDRSIAVPPRDAQGFVLSKRKTCRRSRRL